MTKISIIVPIYNTAPYLEKCLDSLVNQTLKDIEIICINDGSKDDSDAILKEYKRKYKNIVYIKFKHNRGVAAARNIALRIARGEFIGFVDSDDYVDNRYFENLYTQSTNYDIIRGIRVINGEHADGNQYGCLVPSIIRKSLIKKNNLKFPNKHRGEDSTFKRWLYKKTNKILEVVDNGIYYYYMRREGSLSNYILTDENVDNETLEPLVSIILTLYNIKKEYIDACIQSILDQTYKNIEIIIIDDCSPNMKYDYLSNMSDKIKLYRNEINLGLNKSVNKAFTLVNGKYIVRLGSDDLFDTTLIEKEVNALENDIKAGAVCCELQRFGAANNLIKRPKIWSISDIVLNRNFMGAGYAGGFMFRSILLKYVSIDESLKICEDFDFHLQILNIAPILSIHEPLYNYRIHETNLTKTIERENRWQFLESILEKHKKMLLEKIKEKPLVSIITLVHEIDPNYVRKSIKSMLEQTYENIEIIFADDASEKYDYSFVKDLSNKIRYYKNEKNLGLGKNLNKAFGLAHGKYIVRLDSDDLFNKYLIEKEVTLLESDETIEAVCCDLRRFGNVSSLIRRPKEWDINAILNREFKGTGYAGGFMFRQRALSYAYTDERFKMCEDFDFQLQILERGKIASINEALYYYRSHDNSLTHQIKRKERLQILDRILLKHKKYKSSNS